MSKKKAAMMKDLADLNTAMQQGVQGDISFDMDKENMETLNVMLGESKDKVWSKEDIEEFMTLDSDESQSLTEFLQNGA